MFNKNRAEIIESDDLISDIESDFIVEIIEIDDLISDIASDFIEELINENEDFNEQN